jgi:hypothetical protein
VPTADVVKAPSVSIELPGKEAAIIPSVGEVLGTKVNPAQMLPTNPGPDVAGSTSSEGASAAAPTADATSLVPKIDLDIKPDASGSISSGIAMPTIEIVGASAAGAVAAPTDVVTADILPAAGTLTAGAAPSATVEPLPAAPAEGATATATPTTVLPTPDQIATDAAAQSTPTPEVQRQLTRRERRELARKLRAEAEAATQK